MNTDLNHYLYKLPEVKIAKFPLTQRDESKLLVYRKGIISNSIFKNITDSLDPDSLLVFNNTRVIQARMIFHRKSGAKIEIFCLEPHLLNGDLAHPFNQLGKSQWKCLVGNKDKWRKNKEILKLRKRIDGKEITFQAEFLGDYGKDTLVEFTWNNEMTFREILENFGQVPIPPYLNRQDVPSDKQNYQTIYAEINGAVAAPTAGFHFTDKVFGKMEEKGIDKDFVTLHVSAGTFLPIKETNFLLHSMHHEQIIFSRENVEKLLLTNRKIIATGTTSLRALESLYWFGIKLMQGKKNFDIEKLFPYETETVLPDRKIVLNYIMEYMIQSDLQMLTGSTSLFIFPGYNFRMTDGLITNYHQPGSSLLLLVAAFVGEDWKKIYQFALNNDYRFLSYGDSSLLLP